MCQLPSLPPNTPEHRVVCAEGKVDDNRQDSYCCQRHAEQGTHVCPVESMTGSLKILKEMGQKKASGAPASRAAVSKSPLLKLTTPGGTFTSYQHSQAPI